MTPERRRHFGETWLTAYLTQGAGQSPTLARPAAPLVACVKRHHALLQNHLPWLRRLRDRKNNFTLIVCNHSCTNAENLAKIGPVDFEIIGLTGIVKNKDETVTEHNSPPCLLFAAARRAKYNAIQ